MPVSFSFVVREKSVNPDRPACGQSHYCLRYPGSSDAAVAICNMSYPVQLIEHGIVYDAFSSYRSACLPSSG